MRALLRAVVVALLIGGAVATGAYLLAPGRGASPTRTPLTGDVPPSLVHPVGRDIAPVCGAGACVMP